MTTREQSRIQVLNGVIEGEVTVAEASGLMGVSEASWMACLEGRQATTGSVQEGRICCRGSREQREEANVSKITPITGRS